VGTAKEYLHFLSAAVSKPFRMGAIAPSSKRLAEMMLLKLTPGDWIAEIGPGTGAMTRIIQQRLIDPKHYVGVDINREFVEKLRVDFPEMKFVQDSAEHLGLQFKEGSNADYIVCSLPWTIWPAQHQAKILKSIVEPLKNGGVFATFAYWPMLYTPAGIGFRKMLKRSFKKVELTQIVWGNIPPAIVYLCIK
jgi:phosphatidylethanolamine/phosphatidyl-N-methylethanolamine N-methyltransferase